MRAVTRRRIRSIYRDLPAAAVFALAVGLIYVGSRMVFGWWVP